MKKLFILLAVLLSINLYSQTWMQIQKVSGGKDSVKLSDISKIYFTSSTTSFNCGTSTVEYSGKTYNTVLIGSQCWLKENLDIGTMIQGNADPSNNGTLEKYCYDNNAANCTTCGGLYQWNEVMAYDTTSGSKGICPTSWHIPTESEFATLKATVSEDGNALKAIGQGAGAGAGTNTSGFSALLGGFVYWGNFGAINAYGVFWSSTQTSNESSGIYMILYDFGNLINISGDGKLYGKSVRCLKD